MVVGGNILDMGGGGGRDWKKVVRRVEDSLSETMWEMGWPWEAKKERVERKVRT